MGRFAEQIDRAALAQIWEPRARRLTVAQLTSSIGDGMVIAALPFAILAAGGSIGQVGIALAAQAIVMAAVFLPAGVLGDRLNRRSVVVGADLLRFAARGGLAILLVTGEASLWQILVAQVAHGAGTALFTTTMDGFVPDVIDADRLQRINALRGMATSVGATVGPAIGGVLCVTAGAGWAFALDAISFLVSAMLIVNIPMRLAERPPLRSGFQLVALLREIAEGWQAFRGIGWFWRVATLFAVLNTLVFAPFFVLGPAVAEESLGGPAAWAAILFGLGAGQIVGGLVLLSWQPTRPLWIGTILVAVWTVPLLLIASHAPLMLLIASAAAAGASIAVFSVVWDTAKQTYTPRQLRARLGAFDSLGSLGLVPFGYVFGAFALGAVGADLALIGCAGVLLLSMSLVVANPTIRALGSRESGRGDKADPLFLATGSASR